MASSAEIILNSFLEIAGGQWAGVGISDLLRMLVEQQAATSDTTESGGGGAGSTLEKLVSSGFGGSVLGMLGSAAGGSSNSSSASGSGGGAGSTLEQLVSSVFGGSVLGILGSAASGSSGSSSASGSGGGAGSTLGRVASAVFGSALGVAPLAKAIIGLFTGGSQDEPPPLVKYALPPSLRFEAADAAGPAIMGVDYGQNGLARAQASQQPVAAGTYAGEGRGGSTPGPAAQVTIQVNAMDSRSFLDHKEEIARAVREAMLNMHSLNDVVSDL